MARTYTDKLEVRRRDPATNTWSSWQILNTDAVSPFSFTNGMAFVTSGNVLDTGYEYEFKITRSKPGFVSKISDGATDGSPNYFASGTSVSDGGTVSTAGAFSVSSGGNTITVDRVKSDTTSIVMTIAANWDWVAVKYNNGSEKRVFNGKTNSVTSPVTNPIDNLSYTKDTSIVQKNSNTEIQINLPSSQAMAVYIDYAGGSSGTFQVSAL